jgi:hypothetical protein
MKYLGKKFSSPANSKDFVDNWDATFKKETPTKDEPAVRPDPDKHEAA